MSGWYFTKTKINNNNNNNNNKCQVMQGLIKNHLMYGLIKNQR